MGKKTGFLDYKRKDNPMREPLKRIEDYHDIHLVLNETQRREQGARCMNCGTPFCLSAIEINGRVTGCPLHNLIPEWNDEIYQGNIVVALERLLRTNPFPEWTGRVCPALCEKACVCGLYDEAVTIRDNELFVIEQAFCNGWIVPHQPMVRLDKKVAVIGSGPAGLAVAQTLNARGYQVTVFERDPLPGGLLRYGIPEMKLPKKVVDRRIQIMEQEGIVFRTGIEVGKDVTKEKLQTDFDAIAICCGARQPRPVSGIDSDLNGVQFAVDFLTESTHVLESGNQPELAKDKRVIVVGGGDTGNDCVAMCLRMGAKEVLQLEMMPRPSNQQRIWPEWPNIEKIDYGQEEYKALFQRDPRLYQTTIDNVIVEDGRIVAVDLVTGEWIDGRFEKDIEKKQRIQADLILIAAGFVGVESELIHHFEFPMTNRNTFSTRNKCYQIDDTCFFSAGDCHRGPSLVVWAIAEGLACAKEIEKYLESDK